MKKLYFTRHGQTVWNIENKICGATDIALTPTGHMQAVELGNLMKEHPLKIDKILYSPLIRARDTALHIAEITGIPAACEPRLKEQNFGKFESTPRNGAEFLAAKQHFADHFGGGESMLEMAQRIYNLLDELSKDDKIYLLVAHNGIARIVDSYFHDMSNEEFANYKLKNCQVVEYEF